MNDRKRLSRRQFLQLSGTVGAAAVLAACGGTTPPASTASTAAPAAATAAPAAATAAPAAATAAPAAATAAPAAAATAAPATQSLAELLGADMPGSPNHPKGWTTMLPDLPAGLPPSGDPVVIAVSRRVDAQTKFAQGDNLENNPWSRMIQKLFGVKFSVAWTWATDDEAHSKYNLALSSGDMPEYLETVPLNEFVQMVQAGALEDITDAWEKYASDRWKKAFEPYGDLPWTWCKIDGRIYGIPRVEDLAHNDTILWYRADWLDKLSLKPPKTLDELHDVAMAIVKSGIGKGASGTTLGLMSNKQYAHTWYGSLDPIWGSFGLIPDHWSKEGDGLILDALRPEMKDALTLLNQWYKDGIFRKDFFTVETSDSVQDVASGQVGLHFTPSWGANLDAVKNDPEAKWAFTSIPTGQNGKKGRHTENNFRDASFAFRKGAQNIEKIFQITNWMIELTEDFSRRFHGWEGANYAWDGDKVAWTDAGWSPWAIGPIGTRGGGMADPKSVGNGIKYRRDEWSKIAADKRDAMQNLLLEDPTGVQQVSDESRLFILDTAAEGMITALQRLPTPTQLERGADLQKVIDEALIGIIVGEKPISAFDDMVAQWKQQGGDQVTKEVNEWWATKKG